MKPSPNFLRIATLSLAALACTSPICASADTFQIIDLGSVPNSGLWGLTASGTVVIQYEVSIPDDIAYAVIPLSGPGSTDFTPPHLAYDGGTECTPTISSGVTLENFGAIVCNGSHEVYEGFFTSPGTSQKMLGIFTGPDPSDLLAGFVFPSNSNVFMNGLAVNSVGDFAFSLNGGSPYDHYYEAVDLTPSSVPEPSTLLLLGTGVYALFGAVRRRLA